MHPDASKKFKSLDDIYYYGGQSAHNNIAVLDHKPEAGQHEQIHIKKGDLIGDFIDALIHQRISLISNYNRHSWKSLEWVFKRKER